MTHASLFSGIGGFDLAAQWAGIQNIFQVEIDDFCRKVLAKNFPQVARYEDIKTFDGTKYENTINIISGGFPCQPFSIAGKREGTADNRFLWKEMFRVISEVKPTWVVAENVSGILTIEGGMVFEQVCLDLESQGYEVQAFVIPALSQNAPHRRDRVWFIAYCPSKRNGGWSSTVRYEYEYLSQTEQEGTDLWGKTERCDTYTSGIRQQEQRGGAQSFSTEKNSRGQANQLISHSFDTASIDTTSIRLQSTQENRELERGRYTVQFERAWLDVATELCRVDNGLSAELHKLRTSNRKQRIQALGNAIVPQVAYQIFKQIYDNHYKSKQHFKTHQ